MKNDLLRVLVFFILCSAVFFYQLLLHPDEILFPASDIIATVSPWRHFLVESLYQQKIFPLWEPYTFGGVPFFSNPLSGMYYPFTILFFIIPVDLAFKYFVFVDVILLGLFTYCFARQLKLNFESALFAGSTFAFSGKVILSIYAGHIFMLDTLLWFPLVLLLTEKLFIRIRTVYILLLSIIFSLMILAGHTQTFFYCLIAAGIYFSLRLVIACFDGTARKAESFMLVFSFSLSLIIGLLLSAIQLYPSIEYSQYSGRNDGVSFTFASSFAMHPTQVASFVFPHIFGRALDNTWWAKGNPWETAGYIGILPLVLAVIALLYNRNKYILIFSLLSLFSLLFSFGGYTPFFSFFFSYFPFIDTFRSPSRFLFIYGFSMAIIASFGLQYVMEKKLFNNSRHFLLGILFFLVLCIFALVMLQTDIVQSWYNSYILQDKYMFSIKKHVLITYFQKDMFTNIIIIGAFTIILHQYVSKKIKTGTFSVFVIAITFLNLFIVLRPYIQTKNLEAVYNKNTIIDSIKKDTDFYRVFDMTGYYHHVIARNKIQSITGIGPIYLEKYRDYLWKIGKYTDTKYDGFIIINTIENPTILRSLNVKYIITNKRLQNYDVELLLTQKNNFDDNVSYLYTLKNYFSRAFIVQMDGIQQESQTLYVPFSALEKMMSNNASFRENSLVRHVDKISYGINSMSVIVRTDKRSVLFLSEVWYPGWNAYIDGKKVNVYKTNDVFKSVIIDKGEHTVELFFEPNSYKIGKFVSIGTGISILVLFFNILNHKYINKRKIRRK